MTPGDAFLAVLWVVIAVGFSAMATEAWRTDRIAGAYLFAVAATACGLIAWGVLA